MGLINVYIDESELTKDGQKIWIFGITITKDLENAIGKLLELKSNLGLNKEIEIKWRMNHPNAELKSKVKGETLLALSEEFECLVSITKNADKNIAFINVLDQLENYARKNNYQFLNIHFDENCFNNKKMVEKKLESFNGVQCTTFASLNSKYSIGIQYADILAGSFKYIFESAFTGNSKIVEVFQDGIDENIEINLDEFFRETLRYNIWGETKETNTNYDEPYWGSIPIKDCYNKGIVFNGNFTNEEIGIFKNACQFYMGCLH